MVQLYGEGTVAEKEGAACEAHVLTCVLSQLQTPATASTTTTTTTTTTEIKTSTASCHPPLEF